MTIKIMINVAVFTVGALMVYHGFVLLKATKITKIIDRLVGRIKR